MKNGTNIIGRSDVAGVDIGLNSLLCSRKHCVVNVVDDSVSVEDLNVSSNHSLVVNFFLIIFLNLYSHPTARQLMVTK